jgi:hypothetical protein
MSNIISKAIAGKLELVEMLLKDVQKLAEENTLHVSYIYEYDSGTHIEAEAEAEEDWYDSNCGYADDSDWNNSSC